MDGTDSDMRLKLATLSVSETSSHLGRRADFCTSYHLELLQLNIFTIVFKVSNKEKKHAFSKVESGEQTTSIKVLAPVCKANAAQLLPQTVQTREETIYSAWSPVGASSSR